MDAVSSGNRCFRSFNTTRAVKIPCIRFPDSPTFSDKNLNSCEHSAELLRDPPLFSHLSPSPRNPRRDPIPMIILLTRPLCNAAYGLISGTNVPLFRISDPGRRRTDSIWEIRWGSRITGLHSDNFFQRRLPEPGAKRSIPGNDYSPFL